MPKKYKPSQLISVDDVLAEDLKDPEFRELWEKTALARSIALLLLHYRTEGNISQTQLAKKLGVSQPAMARLESGEHNPTFETIQKLSQALQLEIAIDFAPKGKNRKLVDSVKMDNDKHRFEINEASVSVVAI